MRLLLAIAAALALAGPAAAQAPRDRSAPPETGLPPLLQGVGIDQKLGTRLPLDLEFTDDQGRAVRLGDYFGSKPVILTLVYFDCPMLCTQILNGLTAALKTLSFDIGNQFNVVTVSFDPTEGPELAQQKRHMYLAYYNRPSAAEGWPFLTGTSETITALTSAVGYRYEWDDRIKEYAHAAGIMVLTPDGQLSRYFYGIEFPTRDLRLAIVDASEKKIGSFVDAVMLYCYHYNPADGRYGLVVMNAVRVAAVIFLLVVITCYVLWFWGLRARNRMKVQQAG